MVGLFFIRAVVVAQLTCQNSWHCFGFSVEYLQRYISSFFLHDYHVSGGIKTIELRERVSERANGTLCIHCALQWAAQCWLCYCCFQSIVCGIFYILSNEYASYQIFLNNGLLCACAYAGGLSLLMGKNVRQNTNRLYFDTNKSTTAACNGIG